MVNKQIDELLGRIGRDLNQTSFPVVHNGGLVRPGPDSVVFHPPGEKGNYEQQRPRASRSATATRQWPEGWARQAGPRPTLRSWTARPPASLAYDDAGRDGALDQLMVAYPGTKAMKTAEGLWLLVPSTLLPGLGRSALFVIAIAPGYQHVRAWGFWCEGGTGVRWIGPRHTNYPDGSVCAFDSQDRTWTFGNSLVTLADIYSVWAVRHLYLERFGSWPGPQSSSHPYERLMEHRDDEHCSCGQPGRRYGECCKSADLQLNRCALAIDFLGWIQFSERNPPQSVVRLALEQSNHPPLIACISGAR